MIVCRELLKRNTEQLHTVQEGLVSARFATNDLCALPAKYKHQRNGSCKLHATNLNLVPYNNCFTSRRVKRNVQIHVK